MPTSSGAATNSSTRRAAVRLASRRAAAPGLLVLVLIAATPAFAEDETLFSGFMTALNPIARALRAEPPPSQPEAETKAVPAKRDPRPATIVQRTSPRFAVARPPKPRAGREIALTPDPTVTGAIAHAPNPPQPQPQQQESQSPPRPPAAPTAAAAAQAAPTAPAPKAKADATP